jgi:WG containing repeat
MDGLGRDVIVRPPDRAALVCAFTVLAMLCGPGWSAAGQPANADRSCTYASKARRDVLQFEHCVWSDATGHLHLKRKHRLALDFDRHGLASVNIGGGWYYVRQNGQLAPVMTMDNGAEPFADGLARSPVGGKIGFIDRNLTLVVPARYDGALPFEHGWAKVCIACKLASEGEHSLYRGGRWGCIDRHGHERDPFKPGEGADHVCRDDG